LRERLRRLLRFVPEAPDVFALRARNEEEEDHRETFLLILHKYFENKINK
jgi:hypothetical protein